MPLEKPPEVVGEGDGSGRAAGFERLRGYLKDTEQNENSFRESVVK
jgi:hypothetical protein